MAARRARAARQALELDPAACRAYALGFSWEKSVQQFEANLAVRGRS